MYRNGHIGLALLTAAPFALLSGFITGSRLGLLLFGFAFITSSAPDIDQRLPFLSHRGCTHTIWFGIGLSLFLAAGTVLALSPILPGVTLLSGSISATSVVTDHLPLFSIVFIGYLSGFISHLIGDILTEAYDYTVNPFWPVSDKAYTLGWTTADSTAWNWGLLILGGTAALGTIAVI